jgi:hypothetical protein
MEQQLLQTGEETMSKLAGRAAEVQGLVSANFAAKSLADVQASFEAAFVSGAPGAVNAEVVKVHTIVREQAAQVIAACSKAPSVAASHADAHPPRVAGELPRPVEERHAAWMPTRRRGALWCLPDRA